jgi:hypothetical protein
MTGGTNLGVLITKSMEHRPSWESNNTQGNQEISRILWKRNVCFRVHKSPSQTPVLSHMNPTHTPILISLRFSFKSIFLCLDRSKESLSSPRVCVKFRTALAFYGEELLALAQPAKCKTTPCQLSRFLMQYILSYSLYPQAFFLVCNLRKCRVVVAREALDKDHPAGYILHNFKNLKYSVSYR